MKKSVTICLWIIGILFILCFCECGARKVSKEQSKEQTKTETVDNSVIEKNVDANVKTTIETKVDDKNETVTQETIYEPSDNAKESFVIEKDGTKVILNNAKKIVRNTTQKNNTQTSADTKKEEVKKESDKEQKVIKHFEITKKESILKESKRSGAKWYSYWWIYLIILGVLYFLFKRFRIFEL